MDGFRTKEVAELTGLNLTRIHEYKKFFNLKTFEIMQGKKPILYFYPESVDLLHKIIEMRKTESNLSLIKSQLGLLNDSEIVSESLDNEYGIIPTSNRVDNVMKLESYFDEKFDEITDSLDSSINNLKSDFDKIELLQNQLKELSLELGEYKQKVKNNESFIEHLKSEYESKINDLHIISESKQNHIETITKSEQNNINMIQESHKIQIAHIHNKYKSDITNLKSIHELEINSKNQKINDLIEKITSNENEVNYLSENLKIMNDKIVSLENEILNRDKIISEKDKEIDKLKSLVPWWNKNKI